MRPGPSFPWVFQAPAIAAAGREKAWLLAQHHSGGCHACFPSHLFSPSSNLVIWVVSEERAAFFFFSKITTTFSPQAQATPYGHFWVGFLRKKNASFSHG